MPAELDACVQSVLAKNPDYDESRAYAICNAQLSGGSNFVSHNLDDKGDLYLKYFLADSSWAKNTAVGDFSLNGAAIATTANQAIGLPFAILPSRELSLFGDFHPWSPNDGASYDDHVNFARKYSPGHIVAVTANSQLGAAQDVVSNGGRFAIVQITDSRTKDAYVSNPNLIPKAVSPGIMNMEAPNKVNISSFKWAHLAAVPQGAYGSKATLYATCLGGNTPCVNKLIAAGVALRERTISYCPVGASENLYNTSLINSDATSSINMSAQVTPDSNVNTNTQPQTTTPQAKAPVTAPTPQATPQKVLRLKTKGAVNPNDPNAVAVEQPNQPVDTSKLDEITQRVAEIELREQQLARFGQIRNLIDTRLFVTGGKYNQKEHEAAIEEAAKSNWTDDQISKYYGGLLRIKEFEESQNPKNKNSASGLSYNPLGGSAYQTNSSVPELVGAAATAADMDLQTFRTMKVKGLVEMFHLGARL